MSIILFSIITQYTRMYATHVSLSMLITHIIQVTSCSFSSIDSKHNILRSLHAVSTRTWPLNTSQVTVMPVLAAKHKHVNLQLIRAYTQRYIKLNWPNTLNMVLSPISYAHNFSTASVLWQHQTHMCYLASLGMCANCCINRATTVTHHSVSYRNTQYVWFIICAVSDRYT